MIRLFFLKIAARICLILCKLIALTCRFNVEGFEQAIQHFQSSPCILAFWHNRLLFAPYILNRFTPKNPYFGVVSHSKDADILAEAIKSFPHGSVLRVPHNKRHIALRQILDILNTHTILLITPDGPRGPKYKIKPGTLYVAKKTGAKLIPFSWTSSRSWKLKTWDHLEIPKPFSKITCFMGPPQDPNDTEGLESYMMELIDKKPSI
jgi:lysophospholipid acyltransferase (LPLAT)-like uncharacterized protein